MLSLRRDRCSKNVQNKKAEFACNINYDVQKLCNIVLYISQFCTFQEKRTKTVKPLS